MHRVHDLAAVRLGKVKLDDPVSTSRNLNFPGHQYSADAFIQVGDKQIPMIFQKNIAPADSQLQRTKHKVMPEIHEFASQGVL